MDAEKSISLHKLISWFAFFSRMFNFKLLTLTLAIPAHARLILHGQIEMWMAPVAEILSHA